jgi:broad specificity phosphatase PhoE
MKIYLLRHEIRDLQNPTFYSPLLSQGLKNADKLKYTLDNQKIDIIYSSPFKRVLQTVKPYCDLVNKKINIEYSLYEQIYDHENSIVKFDKNDFRKDLKPDDAEYYLKNKYYKSFLPLSKIEYTKHTEKRARNFLNHIIKKYENTDKVILLASHGGIIAQMLGIEDRYPMGGLCLCYEANKRVYKPINF